MNHTAQTLPAISWSNQLVITTELLADVYGVSEKQIRQNFNNNKTRFTERTHFFKLEGADLRGFKNSVENIDSVGKKANTLMLWTERGVVNHAKMIGTDQAWEVQEKLVDFYFSNRDNVKIDKDWELKRQLTKMNYHFHTDAVQEYIIPNSISPNLVYAQEGDIFNIALFGMTAERWRKENPQLHKQGKTIRDSATVLELIILANMEVQNALMVERGDKYITRLDTLKEMAIKQRKTLGNAASFKKLIN